MGFLNDLKNWATDAFKAIFGGVSDVAGALTKLWHYITSVHNLLAWVQGVPVLSDLVNLVQFVSTEIKAYVSVYRALQRIPAWILAHLIMPWVRYLQGLINRLAAKEAADVRMLIADIIEALRIAEAYTDRQVGIERADRIKDVNAARAYALQLVTALHQAVEREASSGYLEDYAKRLGLIGKITDDLAVHNPVIRQLAGVFVRGVLDLAAVDDPVARFALGALLTQVVNRLGVDRVAGDLLGSLLGPLIGRGRPANLHDVMHDIDDRLSALEGNWAEFMADGGPEVEQAGQDWKDLTSPLTDAALLGFFALIVTDPRGAATATSDTIGTVIRDTIGQVHRLF